MGKRGTTFCENTEPTSTISVPYERGTRFTVQLGSYIAAPKTLRTENRESIFFDLKSAGGWCIRPEDAVGVVVYAEFISDES